ncbi:MAG: glycosyltransferase family 2 protein [Lachnospiraceae bacterium]|nr:glycosyltransferase family 2 protein [Lachnospiraceae bacterium]
MKKVSVIIPCYNVEKYIKEALDSILQQTFPLEDIEIIVVDDCSTDNTLNILQRYESQYSDSVILIALDQNNRAGYARNIALSYATAPYIMFVDADDWLLENAIEETYQKIVEYDADVLEFNYVTSYHDDSLKDNIISGEDADAVKVYELSDDRRRRAFYAVGCKNGYPWNKIYKKDFLLENAIVFAEGLKYEDTSFMLLLHLYMKRYAYYDKCLYGYRINQEGTTFGCMKNDYGQFDRMSVQIQMVKECEKRGLLTDYYDIIEANFMRVGYAETFIPIVRRFEHLPHELSEIGKIAKAFFPNYAMNYYLNLPQYKWVMDILRTIENEMTEEDFLRWKNIFLHKAS